MAKTIKIDFKEIAGNINEFFNNTIEYFKHLSMDMMIAWSAVGVGLILIIVGAIII